MVAQRQTARTPKTQAAGGGGKGGGPQAAAAAEESARKPAREAAREIHWVDENGEPIRRKNPGYRNEYDFQPGEVPEGFVYQWIRHTVHGDPEMSELHDMQENGWRPVPHSRHANRFAPSYLSKGDEANGKNGCIARKGQLLVERPVYLNKEAAVEMKRDADQAVDIVFKSKGVPLPSNVSAMGLESRQGRVNRFTGDVGNVRGEFMPKHDIEVE